MRRNAILRLSLAAVLPVAVATACKDNPISGLASGDNSSLGTGNAGSSGSGTNTQGSPTAADTFSLTVHVTARSTTGDATPVQGASVTLTRNEWTFIHGNGGDTMSGHTVTVGSKNTDANGNAQFDQLSADLYRAAVTRPGSNSPDSVASSIQLVGVAKAFLPITLRP